MLSQLIKQTRGQPGNADFPKENVAHTQNVWPVKLKCQRQGVQAFIPKTLRAKSSRDRKSPASASVKFWIVSPTVRTG